MTHQLFLGDASAVAGAVAGGVLLLEGDEGRHAATVVRVRPGERYLVADGAGRCVLCKAEQVDRTWVRGRVVEVTDEPAPQPRLVLVQALAKGDRDEQAIEAATELGVDEVVPWQAERSVVVWRGERAAKSLAKWAAVVARATKQSRRARMPLTTAAVDLRALVARVQAAALTVVLHEEAVERLAGLDLPADGDVLVVVGPEGGISPRELEALTAAGGRPVRLGTAILRSSSAGPAALAVINAATRWR
ncbi:16S rRNA (uracil(1498)-N(3))-methyltransferase [Humibacillus xanthopallidus]|uniref:Ribosomal RNA small subunit methyltransferase E n=1 Tax=Humibacillus xanthopallidus TaxID=412689 RepID=A0A543HWM8_9MICO|nr:16S rRNA (uracil(1498)-N(3))-methyltransferase [Humibacillus xanthopallidus]TQM62781.1 16S rRNA (uracil1498-N3)-methyltransferase [Humibacillus xanthopallidus]